MLPQLGLSTAMGNLGWAAAIFAIAAGAGAALAIKAGYRGRRLLLICCLRAASAAAVAAVIYDAPLALTVTVSRPGPILVAVDCSASMDVADCRGGLTRRRALEEKLLAPGGILDQLARQRRVFTYGFSDMLLPLASRRTSDFQGRPDITDLRASLLELASLSRQTGACAIVLASDGVDTLGLQPRQAARLAQALPPVIAISLGGQVDLPQRAITGISCPKTVRQGQSFQVAVYATVRPPAQAKVTLSGDDLRGKLKAPLEGGVARFKLQARTPGRHRLIARIDSARGELDAADNTAAISYEVLPGKPRIVWLDRPRLEAAFLRRLLASIEGVRLQAWFYKGPTGGWWQELPALKRQRPPADIGDADLVIIGDIPPGQRPRITGASAILWLCTRGNLPLMRRCADGLGAAASAWSEAVAWVTSARGAWAERVFHSASPRLPALQGLALLDLRSARPVVLTDRGPLLAVREGASVRAAVVASDSLYRWCLSPAANDASRAAFRRFWTYLISWLLRPLPRRPVLLELPRLTFRSGEPIIIGAWVREDCRAVRVQLRSDGRTVAQLDLQPAGPRSFQGQLQPPRPGKYTIVATAVPGGAKLGTDSLDVEVLPSGPELIRPGPDPDMLRAIAQATGGRVLGIDSIEELPRLLPCEAVSEKVARQIHPFRTAAWALLIAALMLAEWALRRKWGGI